MEIFRPGGLELTDKAAKYIELKAGDKVLDIGCGFGASLCYLKEKYNAQVYGVELNPLAALKAAEVLGHDCVMCADACKLPFAEESFDAVFMECVLTLIQNLEAALAEAARVLAPGAYLIISSLEGADSLLENGRVGRASLLEKLEAMGFELLLLSDESASLRRFIAEIIFEYDSIENYIEVANRELGGSILNCDVPAKGTGYILLIARKKR